MKFTLFFFLLSLCCFAAWDVSPKHGAKHFVLKMVSSEKSSWRLRNYITTTLFSTAMLLPHALGASPAHAFGPVTMDVAITSYKPVELCNGQKPIMPGQKAAEGLFPVCIEVEANTNNPTKKALSDVSVYGFVKEEAAGNSVLPNNPDFKSDAGQYAMIKTVPPGESHVTYQFVAAVSSDPKQTPLPKLGFSKTKLVSFPGGDKFKPLGECEIDPRADGCDVDEDD